MLKKLMTPIMLALAMFASSASLAQNTTPNVNDPPKPKAPEQNPPAKTPEEKQRERQEQRKREREEAEKNQNGKAGADLPASFYRVSELNGMRIDAKGGEKIGEIRQLAINTENGRVRYAIVDNGSGTLYPIPLGAIKFQKNRTLGVVDTTNERMKDAPTFKPDGWNTIGDNKWGAVVYQFYGINRNADEEKERPDFVSSASVRGAKVETRRGESLGSVRDVMIDTEKGVVAYGVLDFGRDGKLFAVPWQSMTVREGGKNVMMRSVERDDLKDAPGFANNRWPAYKDLEWNKDTNFDSKPPKWIYGYSEVGGGNAGNGGGGNGGGGGDRGALGGWQTNGKYGQMFRSNRVERWRGTIVRTESVTPLTGMDPGVALVVKVEGQGNMVVHLGPEWFVKRQQDKFAANESIDFSGSLVDIDQKPVVMATQVRMQGRVLTLRDGDGVPSWDAWQERK